MEPDVERAMQQARELKKQAEELASEIRGEAREAHRRAIARQESQPFSAMLEDRGSVRVEAEFSPAVFITLLQTAQRQNLDVLETLRRALGVYDHLISRIAEGGRVLVQKKDGQVVQAVITERPVGPKPDIDLESYIFTLQAGGGPYANPAAEELASAEDSKRREDYKRRVEAAAERLRKRSRLD